MNSAFTEIFKRLHDDTTIDPQYARILSDNSVAYSFIQRGFRDILTGHVLCPTDENRKKKLTNAYAESLKFQLGHHGLCVDIDEDKIVLTYKPKSEEELLAIRRFLETIPEEEGNLPEKGATFFCYD